MNKKERDLELMEKVLEKWERVHEGGIEDGINDCAFCQEYEVYLDESKSCNGCPIFNFTQKRSCRDTPYITWGMHQNRNHPVGSRKIECPECVKIIDKEIEFLNEVKNNIMEE